MWAIFFAVGQVCAAATAQVTPSADWMLVMRNANFGFGTALSHKKSVQPSTKMVSRLSSSATGPSAGVLPLDMTPVNMSIFSESFMRRSSFTLASVPAFSSAVMVSILRLPRIPPCALISSAASMWPLSEGSPSTAAGPVRKVMWPNLSGVAGIFPFGGLSTCATAGAIAGTVAAAAPIVIPRLFRKFLRFSCCCVMDRPPFRGSGATLPPRAEHTPPAFSWLITTS